MPAFEKHPTSYGKLSNEELNAMWRSSVFDKLSAQEKLELCQETVNRDSLERGMIGAPEVR